MMRNSYDDIINLPHHTSKTRMQMSLHDRAAQFSPFAALTGHDAAIKETARLTDRRIELDEDIKIELNKKLQIVTENLNIKPEITVLYFQSDERKTGGAYVTLTGCVKKIDVYERIVIMADGTVIAIDDILDMESDLFEEIGCNNMK